MHVWFQRTRQHIVTVLQPKTRAKQHPKIQQWHLPCGNQNNTQRFPERQPYSNSRHLYNQDNTQNSTQMSNHNTPLTAKHPKIRPWHQATKTAPKDPTTPLTATNTAPKQPSRAQPWHKHPSAERPNCGTKHPYSNQNSAHPTQQSTVAPVQIFLLPKLQARDGTQFTHVCKWITTTVGYSTSTFFTRGKFTIYDLPHSINLPAKTWQTNKSNWIISYIITKLYIHHLGCEREGEAWRMHRMLHAWPISTVLI